MEATLDLMITGCSVCLVFEAMSLVDEISVAAVIGAGVSMGGTSDLMEGSSEILSLFLQVRGVRGGVC